MRTIRPWSVMLACGAMACAGVLLAAPAVPPPEAADERQTDEAGPGDTESAEPRGPLSDRQERVRERFVELERLLLRMAELTASTDPRRAALLRRAVAQSKNRDIDHQFAELVELLQRKRLALAIKGQDDVQRELATLLELLMSEDRGKRIESEKERIRAYLKRVNKIIKEQKSIRGATARDRDTDQLAERQGELGEKTGELAQDLQQDAAKNQAEEEADKEADKEADADKEAKDPGDPQPDDSKTDKGSPGDGQKPGQKNKPGDAGQPQDSPPSDPKDGGQQNQPPMPGQPKQGGEPSSEQQQSDHPAQQRLERAQQRMREAQQKLEDAQREGAAEKQAEAIKELERAKAELEEILRQLREEEMSRMLAMLESRFRKMLDAQIEVYEGTQRVDNVPASQRDRDDEIEAGRLSRKEAQIVVEADKCLSLLREEGSAVAFPEAVVEMREDMQQVVERLAQAKVGELTQSIETDIIAALEEMIAALKKAQKDLEQQQQQPQGQPANGEPALVDTLAELRMIRALQMRVNRRTQRYFDLTNEGHVDTPELLQAIKRLAEREARIHEVTRDIVVGRNR